MDAARRAFETVQVRMGAARHSAQPVLRRLAAADLWLRARTEWIVWAVVLAGLYLRVHQATKYYFNGDEGLTTFAPLQQTLAGVYRAMLWHPHGPFSIFLLHFMSRLGSSEFWFRLPTVLAGAAVPYVAYRWVADTYGRSAGLVTAVLFAFSPAMIILSGQMRFYEIQMFFLTCSLYCLERSFREKSRAWMNIFGGTLVLALTTEYESILYIAAIGVYALVRIARRELPTSLALQWAGTQALAAGVVLAAYFTHLRHLQGNQGERFARDVWLRSSYHQPGQSYLGFFQKATDLLFGYVFSNAAVGTVMVFAFALGLALILVNQAGVPSGRRLPALALLLPLLVTAGAAFLPLYPYGGSRHDAFLAMPIFTGVGVFLAALARWRVVAVVLAGLYLVPTWVGAAEHHYLDDVPQVSRIGQMRNALNFLQTRQPAPRVIISDQNGGLTLGYYVCHGEMQDFHAIPPNMTSYRCGAFRILTVEVWSVAPPALAQSFLVARKALPDLFPDPAWVFAVTPDRRADVSISRETSALFGKLELFRASPPWNM